MTRYVISCPLVVNARGSVQVALDKYASSYCMSLVEIAIEGHVSDATLQRLRRERDAAAAKGATERTLRGTERWCDRQMVPKLKKLFGVDVRKQQEMF